MGNILLMRRQNIVIDWNELMLWHYALMLHYYSYSLAIHACFTMALHYGVTLHVHMYPPLNSEVVLHVA